MSYAQRTVDYLVVSTGRAASTAVYRYVSLLGGLNLPRNKEPHFWCNLDQYHGLYPLLREIAIDKDEDYWPLYSDSRYVVDASVGYFFCLDEVISRLDASGQLPKVIFLYRDPESRAGSLFNELRKKNLTRSGSLLTDLQGPVGPGYWWEYYYDNVDYFDNFLALESYFDEILAVNYAFFAENQLKVMREIMDFMQIPADRIGTRPLPPINSSAEAILAARAGWLWRFGSFAPGPARALIRRALAGVAKRSTRDEATRLSADIRSYLPRSLAQYEKFRDHIKEENLLWLRRS